MRWTIFALTLLAVVGRQPARGIDDENEDEAELPTLVSGLVARYKAPGGETCQRRDDSVQFAWGDHPPDERLPMGNFSVEWRGRLFTIAPGTYRIFLYAAGDVAVELSDQNVLVAQADQPRWFESPPIELEYGYHSLEIRFQKTSDAACIGLYWSGPQFELEPVSVHALWHEPADEPDHRFERGGELWRAMRCANCHRERSAIGNRAHAGTRSVPGTMAADLTRLSGNVSRRWLRDWLRHSGLRPAPTTASPPRMPNFGLSENEAQAIADFLLAESQAQPNDPEHPAPLPPGNAKRGQRLALTLGCLACHQLGNLGSAGLFSGGDLTRIAEKRPADFFARWLEDPASINLAHRMPVFRMSPGERSDLAAFLATLGALSADTEEAETATASHIERGKQLVDELRCCECHRLPRSVKEVSIVPGRVHVDRLAQGGCLGPPDRSLRRPGYELAKTDREALVSYLTGRISPAALDGQFVLRERNCLGCHARDGSPGIAEQLPMLTEAHPELAPLTPTLSPPSLTQVGDKLHDGSLADAILLRGPPLRPWLAVRMPRFDLWPAELEALRQYFTTVDRIPERPQQEIQTPLARDHAALVASGSRLVTSTGFGCTSCHKIGHSLPIGVSLAAHGTDLSYLGRRIRRSWFDRWVHNPSRVVPRIEMPSIQVPVPGVLGGRLSDQLAAVWHVLNMPGFEPPRAGPIRIARHDGQAGPAVVITDQVETSNQVFLRPLVVGLPNRHNLLFDLAANQWAGWWLGDTARQHTRGKAWYWEVDGHDLFGTVPLNRSEVELFDGEQALDPVQFHGQARAELDRWQQITDGVRFAYRIQFANRPTPLTLLVEQELAAAENEQGRGFRRRWQIRGVPEDNTVHLRLSHFGQRIIESGNRLSSCESGISIAIISPPNASLQRSSADGRYLKLASRGADVPIVCEAIYLSGAATDSPAAQAPPESTQPAMFHVVPGYEAMRLALPRDEMPTGLAWRDEGALAFCSLKGGVWLARDSDGDGLEDQLHNFADGLPAPYGIAAFGDSLDVCAKYGLVRLTDADDDDRAENAEVVASGWGYTADYHDWTVGLPRDANGNYYVGLPCQQDDRSVDDAYLRGAAVKLVPREASPAEPRRYALEAVSAGLRFPMGLALSRDGALFATDNQGNYTPFNELNHLKTGARYGFINKLEAIPGFQPAFEEPAVAIPHPWTRSVNGICFLNTPDAVRRKHGGDVFGPFEGQLLGCEYDTRRLIRISLEKIGDTYQGAVYPFSVEPAAGSETFEGPVVCAVSPAGDLYIGNLRDSGWGGGQNTGSIVRLRPTGELPRGIAEVRAESDGFSIAFTGPVVGEQARLTKNYSVSSYRRIATPAYGGPDVDRADEAIVSVEVSPDAKAVRLRMARLRPGFVYELRVANLAPSGRTFFPSEAYFTLRRIP